MYGHLVVKLHVAAEYPSPHKKKKIFSFPDVKIKYLNIMEPFQGKENNNWYNLGDHTFEKTSLGLFYIQFLPIDRSVKSNTLDL